MNYKNFFDLGFDLALKQCRQLQERVNLMGFVKRIFLLFSIILFLSFFSYHSVAEAKSTWITDKKTGCKTWNPRPILNESISWSGECKNGKTHGYGTLIWFKDGKQNGDPVVGNYFEGFYIGKNTDFKGQIIGLPYNDYLISLGTDEKTKTVFWAYSAREKTNRCWYRYQQHYVFGMLPSNKSKEILLNSETARSLIIKGAEFIRKACSSNRAVEVRLIPNNYKITSGWRKTWRKFSPVYVKGEIGVKGGKWPNWNIYKNYVLESAKKLQAAEAKKAKEEKERKEAQKLLNEFVKKNGVKEWPSIDELSANPFVYEDTIVGLTSSFSTMQSATQGVFERGGEPLVVSNIPKGMFRTEGQVVVLAGEVLGKTELKVPFLGLMQVPNLKFVGVHFCNTKDCRDIIRK